MLGLSNVNVVVTVGFASHSWMFHVLRLSEVHVVVALGFASHRLLRLMYWTFHVLRQPNMNAVVTLTFASYVAAHTVLDVSCVTTIYSECHSIIVFCPCDAVDVSCVTTTKHEHGSYLQVVVTMYYGIILCSRL